MKSITYKFLATAISFFVLTGCDDDFESPASPEGSTITQLVVTNPELDILEAALVKTGLATIYANNNSGLFTVFAPNDAAFAAFIQATYSLPSLPTEQESINRINSLTNISTPLNLGTLVSRLNYHVFSSELKSSQVSNATVFATLNGARLSLSLAAPGVLINANSGTTGSKVTVADGDATNGVVHTIDKVLAVPSVASIGVTLGFSVNYAVNPPSVSGAATAGSNYDVLSAAIRKAGLATALLPNITPLPDFTVFAPTDAAFVTFLGVANEAAAIATVNGLSESTTPKLSQVADILKYHVVAGRVLSTDLSSGQQVTSLLTGKVFTIATLGPPVEVSDLNAASANARISSANILTNAGVVHGISVVLNPNP